GAETHVTTNPTCSKVAQARLVCRGDVTTATRRTPRWLSDRQLFTASSRVVWTESTMNIGNDRDTSERTRIWSGAVVAPSPGLLGSVTTSRGATLSRISASPTSNRSNASGASIESGVMPPDSTITASRGSTGN